MRMLDTYLVPQKTAVTAKGDGTTVDIGLAQNRVFLLQLEITGVVEQESIEVSLYGGPDEAGIGKAPVAILPQRFYAETYPFLLNLQERPEIKVVRAHWEANRWGRGPETPWFEFGLRITEVAPELLREREAK
jgi:hypothetical protein